MRNTRRARMMRTMPVGSSVRTTEASDIPTTKTSSQHHKSVTKGRNQVEKATITSSTVKMIVKLRLSVLMAVPRAVGEPLRSVRLLTYCDSRMVQTKLCAQLDQNICSNSAL